MDHKAIYTGPTLDAATVDGYINEIDYWRNIYMASIGTYYKVSDSGGK